RVVSGSRLSAERTTERVPENQMSCAGVVGPPGLHEVRVTRFVGSWDDDSRHPVRAGVARQEHRLGVSTVSFLFSCNILFLPCSSCTDHSISLTSKFLIVKGRCSRALHSCG